MPQEFEWDEAKRLSNIEKHDIDFLKARLVFDGRPMFTIKSDRTSEERFKSTSVVDHRFITVVWTLRAGAIRIISARSARNAEKRTYRSLYG